MKTTIVTTANVKPEKSLHSGIDGFLKWNPNQNLNQLKPVWKFFRDNFVAEKVIFIRRSFGDHTLSIIVSERTNQDTINSILFSTLRNNTQLMIDNDVCLGYVEFGDDMIPFVVMKDEYLISFVKTMNNYDANVVAVVDPMIFTIEEEKSVGKISRNGATIFKQSAVAEKGSLKLAIHPDYTQYFFPGSTYRRGGKVVKQGNQFFFVPNLMPATEIVPQIKQCVVV